MVEVMEHEYVMLRVTGYSEAYRFDIMQPTELCSGAWWGICCGRRPTTSSGGLEDMGGWALCLYRTSYV